MKRLMLAFVMLISVAVAAQTEKKKENENHPGKTPEQRADAYAARMEKALTLTPEQKTKVRDLALERARKMDELREKYKDQDKKVWQAERKKVRDDFHAGMKATLSPDLYAKWIEMQKKHEDKTKGKGKNKGKAKGKDKAQSGTSTTTRSSSDTEEESDKDLDGE